MIEAIHSTTTLEIGQLSTQEVSQLVIIIRRSECLQNLHLTAASTKRVFANLEFNYRPWCDPKNFFLTYLYYKTGDLRYGFRSPLRCLTLIDFTRE